MNTFRWHILGSLVVIHLTALAAWATFTWEGFVAFFLLYQVTGLGITVGYHRYLTHASFKACIPVHWALILLGMSAAQGTALEWPAVHRKHHVYSDTEDDPHSPHHGGLWWAHMGWLFATFSPRERDTLYARYAKDLLQDPFLRFVSHPVVYLAWILLTIAAIGGVGFAIGGIPMCLSFLVYGVFVRLVVVYHVTWAVNSATHVWGYRSHMTTDQSRNLWWVALLSGGEGWHNNHHASQKVANHGQRWFEVDPSAWVIRTLAAMRLVWNVSWYNVATNKVEILYRR